MKYPFKYLIFWSVIVFIIVFTITALNIIFKSPENIDIHDVKHSHSTPGKAKECPEDMIPVHGSFCIDRYEFPNKYGQTPTSNITGNKADLICSRQGKRLCKTEEWISACESKRNKTLSSSNDPVFYYLLENLYEWTYFGEKAGRDIYAACRGTFERCDMYILFSPAQKTFDKFDNHGFRCCL